ncbi:MAG: sensor histidine kinase [Waterburya sp.]
MSLLLSLKINSKYLHKKVWQPIQSCWKQIIKAESLSSEYVQWRSGFILKRLYLMTWVAVIVCSLGQLVSWTIFIPSYNPSSPEYQFVQQNLRLINGTTIILFLGLFFTFVLLKVSYTRRYPILILFWLTFVLLLIPQIVNTIFFGQIALYGYDWIIVFTAGSILMPVKWRSHCLCQVVVLLHFGVSYFVFGLRSSFVENQTEYFEAVYATIIVCLIVNLAVFLYERFLQQEFELKQQLRLFLHTVSHDLRSPVLGTIFLLKSLRNSESQETVVNNEILDQMIATSDRQLQLIDSLLEAHVTKTRGIILHPRPICLDNLIESVIVEMQPFLDQQQATITKKIPAKLPLVNIDPLQIIRVYENLIANALEYNRPGLHLTFQVENERITLNSQEKIDFENWIYCFVSDNGEGISPQQSTQIFELYTRAASKKQSLNVGLGLYICRQIIKAHGGEIGVDSSSKGANFWFTLPIANL